MKIQGINIQHPFSQLIANHEKKVETRNYHCPSKFINKPLLLIETSSKRDAKAIGIIIFGNSYQYKSLNEYILDSSRHRVEEDNKYYWKDLNLNKYAWEIIFYENLKKPIDVPKKRGYVWTTSIHIPSECISKQLAQMLAQETSSS